MADGGSEVSLLSTDSYQKKSYGLDCQIIDLHLWILRLRTGILLSRVIQLHYSQSSETQDDVWQEQWINLMNFISSRCSLHHGPAVNSQYHITRCRRGLTFTWWAARVCVSWHKPAELGHCLFFFFLLLASVSVLAALSTVFHSLNYTSALM